MKILTSTMRELREFAQRECLHKTDVMESKLASDPSVGVNLFIGGKRESFLYLDQ